MSKVKVDSTILMWAFRYALGRMTYSVDDVVKDLKTNWDRLDPFMQYKIHEEIETAIKSNNAGMDCDIKKWESVLALKPNKLVLKTNTSYKIDFTEFIKLEEQDE